jgi:hypothetical protein
MEDLPGIEGSGQIEVGRWSLQETHAENVQRPTLNVQRSTEEDSSAALLCKNHFPLLGFSVT